jgi:hypothetical protein
MEKTSPWAQMVMEVSEEINLYATNDSSFYPTWVKLTQTSASDHQWRKSVKDFVHSCRNKQWFDHNWTSVDVTNKVIASLKTYYAEHLKTLD